MKRMSMESFGILGFVFGPERKKSGNLPQLGFEEQANGLDVDGLQVMEKGLNLMVMRPTRVSRVREIVRHCNRRSRDLTVV